MKIIVKEKSFIVLNSNGSIHKEYSKTCVTLDQLMLHFKVELHNIDYSNIIK